MSWRQSSLHSLTALGQVVKRPKVQVDSVQVQRHHSDRKHMSLSTSASQGDLTLAVKEGSSSLKISLYMYLGTSNDLNLTYGIVDLVLTFSITNMSSRRHPSPSSMLPTRKGVRERKRKLTESVLPRPHSPIFSIMSRTRRILSVIPL